MNYPLEVKLSVLIVLSSIGLSFSLLLFFEKLSGKIGLLDIPNHRSSHEIPVPRGAGVCFALSSIITLFGAYTLSLITTKIFLACVLGSSFVTLIGFMDDILSLKAVIRLTAQFLAAVLVMWVATNGFNSSFEVRFLPYKHPVLSIGFGLLFIIWMVNLYNFMDGVDGIAGTQAIAIGLLSSFLCVMSDNYSLALTYFIVAAAVIPFQFRNWYPARIFMGDSGAYFLGFAFACLGVIGKVQYEQSLVAHITLMGAFICDATLTLLIRFKNSHPLLEGHRSHGFHKLLTVFNWSPRQISLFYLFFTILWFFPAALLALKYKPHSVIVCLGSYLPFLVYLIYVKVGVEKTDND